jgi:hypothetical protein
MALLDCYYRFESSTVSKARTRRDLVRRAGEYEPLHRANSSGTVCLYLSDASSIKSQNRRKPQQRISDPKSNHISAVYRPEPSAPCLGYGDVRGTHDALLFVFSDDTTIMEVFIAKGKSTVVQNLFDLLHDGELAQEIERLRRMARPDKT